MYVKCEVPGYLEGSLDPVLVMEDEHGGQAIVVVDDGCYVPMLRNSILGSYNNTSWIFPELFEEMKNLPSLMPQEETEAVEEDDGQLELDFTEEENGDCETCEDCGCGDKDPLGFNSVDYYELKAPAGLAVDIVSLEEVDEDLAKIATDFLSGYFATSMNYMSKLEVNDV